MVGPECYMRFPTVAPYMQHDVINDWDSISNMRVPMIGRYMQHEVTNGETLYVT